MRRIFCTVPVALMLVPQAIWACAVCYGDPESDMAKGAVAGVLVLMGVIVSVLGGVVGMMVFWICRARRLALQGREMSAGFSGVNGRLVAADVE